MPMTPYDWIGFCCQELAGALSTNHVVGQLTTNDDLKGEYAEASVREFIKRFIFPLKLSHGAIVHEGQYGGQVPQLDAIVWQPVPLPPIIEAGEFAMVPRLAALAYMEIKRSNYSSVGQAIEAHLALQNELVPELPNVNPAANDRALGVICLYTDGKSDTRLDALIAKENAAIVLRRKDVNSPFHVDTDGITRLSKFLVHVRLRARILDGAVTLADRNKISSMNLATTLSSTTSST